MTGLRGPAFITINGPGHDGTRLALEEGITSFGRLPSNDVVLDDDLVSRNHARITFFQGRAALQDLGSHNGCYVNGERVDGPRPLRSGDLCRLGPFQILFRVESAVGRPAPTGPLPPSSSLLEQIEAARAREHPRALQVLLRATEALASASEIDDYVGSMLRLALDQTGAERGAYVERAPEGLQVRQVAGPEGPATDARVAPAVVAWAVDKQYPLRVDDLSDDLRFSGPAQALLCVPVMYGPDVLGAVQVARDDGPFDPDALDSLVAVAHLTGVGIQASRARRTATRARLTRDALARSFPAPIADALANEGRTELTARQVTLVLITARQWPAEPDVPQSRARLSQLLDAFCDRVDHHRGRWHLGPGPTLWATFEDDAGPARAVSLFDDLKAASAAAPTLRGAVIRGLVLTGVADSDHRRLPVLAGPGLEAAEALVERVPAGQVWLGEAAARLYPGPQRAIATGAYLPT